jgi:hypothetical protein
VNDAASGAIGHAHELQNPPAIFGGSVGEGRGPCGEPVRHLATLARTPKFSQEQRLGRNDQVNDFVLCESPVGGVPEATGGRPDQRIGPSCMMVLSIELVERGFVVVGQLVAIAP